MALQTDSIDEVLNKYWQKGEEPMSLQPEALKQAMEQKDEAGSKYDAGKLRMDLIPIYPLREWAKVLTMGAKKYADRNWEMGMSWSRLYAAAQRHMTAFWAREDLDPEWQLHHLSHAMCCISFLLEYTQTHKELDDRPERV